MSIYIYNNLKIGLSIIFLNLFAENRKGSGRMEIKVKHKIGHPPEVVYKVFRDKMMEYVKYLPNVTKVVIMERQDIDDNLTRMRVQWHGMGQIPEIIRSILKPEMISWEDWEDWDTEKLECRWVIKPYYFTEFVRCEGAWRFNPSGDSSCIATCDGVFNVTIKEFPPFPKFIVKKASPAIEKMIGTYLGPNLKNVFSAVEKMIEHENR